MPYLFRTIFAVTYQEREDYKPTTVNVAAATLENAIHDVRRIVGNCPIVSKAEILHTANGSGIYFEQR